MSIAHFYNRLFSSLFTYTRISKWLRMRNNSHVVTVVRNDGNCSNNNDTRSSVITGQRKICSTVGANQIIVENIALRVLRFR